MSASLALATKIQSELEASSLPKGELIGNQADLCHKFQVTPAVLRQAVRILEARDVVTIKRGTGGGVFIKEVSLDTIANYMATLWEIEGTDLKYIIPSSRAIQRLALAMADRNMSVDDIATLRRLQQDCLEAKGPIERSQRAIVRENFIASLSKNPFLIMAHAISVRFIGNTLPFEYLDLEVPGTIGETDLKVEALIAGDVYAAVTAADAYMAGLLDRLREWTLSGSHTKPVQESFDSSSRPVWLARQIIRVIRGEKLGNGDFLGTESELIARFGVGRRTWRQALSLLEEHPAVESRRGTGGGIYVTDPNANRATEMVQGWFTQQAAPWPDFVCVEQELYIAHLEDLAGQAHDNRSDYPAISNPTHDGRFDALLAQISALSDCPILRMFSTTFQPMASLHEPVKARAQDVDFLISRLQARDFPAARRGMRNIFGRVLSA